MTLSDVEFDRLLNRAAELRGHLCIGLPLGLKMASLGLRLLGVKGEKDYDNLIVFVESDRCTVDAIQVMAKCSAGSRRLKVLEYGKSAASFIDRRTGTGFRIVTKNDFMKDATELAIKDGIMEEGQSVGEGSQLERRVMMNAFMKMTPEELFDAQEVILERSYVNEHKRTHEKVLCSNCGETVMDGKGTTLGDRVLCRACSGGAYYRVVKSRVLLGDDRD